MTQARAVRFARPVVRLDECALFYRDVVGLDALAQFHDHDGFSGVVFLLPGGAQLELVRKDDDPVQPSQRVELVLHLGSAEAVDEAFRRIQNAGHEPIELENPYWARNGAVAFADPDGCPVILAVWRPYIQTPLRLAAVTAGRWRRLWGRRLR